MNPLLAGTRYLPAILLLSLGLSAGARAATAWSQFRGPNGQGVADDSTIPARFGPEEAVRWKVPIGNGHSSPVLWGERIFVTTAQGNELRVICLNRKSGKILWSQTNVTEKLQKSNKPNIIASSTPVADAERVYVYSASFGLMAYDHLGKEAWRRPVTMPKSRYGTATSPVRHGDLVLLLLDSDDNTSQLTAWKAATGEPAWSTPRPQFRSSWTTPMLWSNEGRTEIVVLGSGRLAAYAPENGRQLWWAGGFPPETIGVPVAGDGLVFASSAAMGGRADESYDVAGSWAALLKDFDKNGDGLIQRTEMTKGFAIPLRLELPRNHSGYPFPIGNLDGFLRNLDRDGDQAISDTEWKSQMAGFASAKPALLAVRAGATEDARARHLAWESHRHIPEIPSALYYRKRLYLVRDGGFLSCLEAATGKELFDERLNAPGQYAASPVAAAGRILVASANGVITVLEAGDQPKVVHQVAMNEAIFATPALSGKMLYLRTAGHLWAIGEP